MACNGKSHALLTKYFGVRLPHGLCFPYWQVCVSLLFGKKVIRFIQTLVHHQFNWEPSVFILPYFFDSRVFNYSWVWNKLWWRRRGKGRDWNFDISSKQGGGLVKIEIQEFLMKCWKNGESNKWWIIFRTRK